MKMKFYPLLLILVFFQPQDVLSQTNTLIEKPTLYEKPDSSVVNNYSKMLEREQLPMAIRHILLKLVQPVPATKSGMVSILTTFLLLILMTILPVLLSARSMVTQRK